MSDTSQDPWPAVAASLLAAINANGVTQAQVARNAGTDRSYIHAVLHGHKTPTLRVAVRVARACGFDLRLVVGEGAQGTPRKASTPVCRVCKDTRLMPWHERNGDVREVMCTACPVPCQDCRSGGNGAYCERIPCECTCHTQGAA